jgi:hypothetical protein
MMTFVRLSDRKLAFACGWKVDYSLQLRDTVQSWPSMQAVTLLKILFDFLLLDGIQA